MLIVLQLCSALLGLVMLWCLVVVAIAVFKQSIGLGILYLVVALATCGIGGLVWGWIKAKEYDLQKVMTVWTICWAVNLIVCFGIVREAGEAMRRAFQESTEGLAGEP